uniref:Ferritin n=1 Tax=Megaselia scalaris TaxID=36166 RepID=T1H2E1_MEGSC
MSAYAWKSTTNQLFRFYLYQLDLSESSHAQWNQSRCVDSIRARIQKEIFASYQYLAMAAYFSRDTVNRPGFTEHFFGASKEDALHLIEYLSMRRNLTSVIINLITNTQVKKAEWINAVEALTDALELNAELTKSIRGNWKGSQMQRLPSR